MKSSFNKGWLWPVSEVILGLTFIVMGTGALLYSEQHAKPQELPPEVELEKWNRTVKDLRAQYRNLEEELQRLPSPDDLPGVDLNALEARRQRLLERLKKLRQELARQQAALEQQKRQKGELENQRQQLLEELRRLEKRLKELEARMRKMRFDREQQEALQRELENLKRQLAAKQKDYRELQEAIAKERAKRAERTVRIEVHPRVHLCKGKGPAFVFINKAIITPVCEPYFRPAADRGGHDFVKAGLPASEALRPGSPVLEWLDSLDNNKQFVFALVDHESFETFRAIRAEARRRGLAVGWEPSDVGTVSIRFTPSGTIPTAQ